MFKIRSNDYQQYLIAGVYKPHKMSKQFSDAMLVLPPEKQRGNLGLRWISKWLHS